MILLLLSGQTLPDDVSRDGMERGNKGKKLIFRLSKLSLTRWAPARSSSTRVLD